MITLSENFTTAILQYCSQRDPQLLKITRGSETVSITDKTGAKVATVYWKGDQPESIDCLLYKGGSWDFLLEQARFISAVNRCTLTELEDTLNVQAPWQLMLNCIVPKLLDAYLQRAVQYSF
ncbi:MAG: hypothetical protein ABIG95_04895 [Candidatus Woesearchaeota archaeon]